MRLTDKNVAHLALPPDRTDRIFFDSDLKGFGYRLRVGAGGRILRNWIAQYKRSGRNRRVLIGPAEVLTAEQARGAAKRVLAQVALGRDPADARRRRRASDSVTMRSTVEDYLTAAAARLRPRSLYETRRYLVGPHFKALHGLALDAIDRRAVAARLVAIERESGANSAAKARAALSGFFVWAMRSGLADANPVNETPRPAVGPARERVLDNGELAAIWRAAGDDDHGRIVRLLILTAGRRAEIGGMTWDEVDLAAGIWTLTAARSKNKRPHSLPIMPRVAEIIAGIPRRVTRDFLFGTHSVAGFNGWDEGKRALDVLSGVSGWVLHDLRRTVATRMADLGIAPHVVEEILNHQSGHRRGVAGTYNRSRYEGEVRAALALWHDRIRVIADVGERKVLPFATP